MADTQPAVDALKASLANTRVLVPYSESKRTPIFRRAFAGMISLILMKFAGQAGAKADQPQSNGLFGAHQFRVTEDGITYRVIVAPAEAPISIGGVPADQHFNEPLEPSHDPS